MKLKLGPTDRDCKVFLDNGTDVTDQLNVTEIIVAQKLNSQTVVTLMCERVELDVDSLPESTFCIVDEEAGKAEIVGGQH